MPDTRAESLVDHLFRHQHGRMVAALTRLFGSRHLELAEEVVQDALLKALQVWPFRGIPDDPAGWLLTVARNRALDLIRRETSLNGKRAEMETALRISENEPAGDSSLFEDDQLQLVFLCCHPELHEESRIALTLKIAAGFGVAEIARAFMVQESTIAQRLVRAKRQIRERDLRFEVPPARELRRRLQSVLQVLYLLFNEGYSAHSGDHLVRTDICQEAIRLMRLVCLHPAGSSPESHALLALMLLQQARSASRTNPAGDLWLLRDQDRSLWDRQVMSEGLIELERSAQGSHMSRYHIEAGIAAAHAVAPSFDETCWPHIRQLYDDLYQVNPTPLVALNRTVSILHCEGAEAGLQAFAAIPDHPGLARYHLYYAVQAELLLKSGQSESAVLCFQQALACECSEPERRFLRARLSTIAEG